MIRLIVTLLLFTLLGTAAAWLAEHPGSVTMRWEDYRIDTSVAFLIALGIASGLSLSGCILLLRSISHAPRLWSGRRRLSHYKRGLSEITTSVAALASADMKTAELHTRRAEKLLGPTPLTLLLTAQIARAQGDTAQTRVLLEQMLAHKETEYLAARFLSESAHKQQLFPKALLFAQRAVAVNPKEKAATVAMISLHVRMQQWQEALHAIAVAARKGHFKRGDARRFRGIVALNAGRQLLEQDPAAVLPRAQQALKLLPGFVPAALLAAQAYDAHHQQRKAIAVLFSAWKHAPHPELAALLRQITAGDSKERQLKLAQKLAALLPAHVESHLALARSALPLREWAIVRAQLTAALAQEESAAACQLMADVEQQEFNDFDAAGKWLAKSTEALPAPHWVCQSCANASAQWVSHCPACDAFDTLEWKRQELRFVG